MRLADLDLHELLSSDPDGGLVRFAGQRAVIIDAVALGFLRKELIELLGFKSARTILSRFGYAHGWRTAETLGREFPWDDPAEWRRAGGMLHSLQGLVRAQPVPPHEGDQPFAEALLTESYEAEQHLLHLGAASEPVCWTLTGYAAGYLSFANGREIVTREETCVGRGDPACRLVGRYREEWKSRDVMPFDRGLLEASLEKVSHAFRHAERKRAEGRRPLVRASEEVVGLVAKSEPMRKVVDFARRVAKVESTVLVTGESGTGKERIADLVHRQSQRAAGPFVAVDCGAVTETLLESELFGHVRGAFTGASQDRVGLFEAASHGTLFLDEVGEMSLGMQAKLLRAVQELEVRRVGESVSRKVDVRVICATNRDLGKEVELGRFRKDLYYRLAVVEIHIPPLRERPDDVLPLARALLAGVSERMGKRVAGITPRAADQLQRHRWPGNVRELENALEQAAALCESGRIDWSDLPESVRVDASARAGPTGAVQRTLEEIERDAILAALEAHGGNQQKTAVALGIGSATLYRKLKRWREERKA
jgi:two-component system, NtrC family, response regulator HydG